MDIYKRYKELEEQDYQKEQKIYYLETELAKVCTVINNHEPFDNVEKNMKEQFGEDYEA